MPYAVAGVREMLVAMDDINRASHWSLQIGGFLSPAGQNALAERGLSLVLWTQR